MIRIKAIRTFSIRCLLALVTLAAVTAWLAVIPSKRADEIKRQLTNAPLVGPHQYLDDETRVSISGILRDSMEPFPECTHSYEIHVPPKTLTDWMLFRQPVEVSYTMHPIPPAYQGAINRVQESYWVGMASSTQTQSSSKVLWEYFD